MNNEIIQNIDFLRLCFCFVFRVLDKNVQFFCFLGSYTICFQTFQRPKR